MRKYTNKLIIMSLASLLLHACQAVSAPQAPIKEFSFNFDGTIGGMYNWTIKREDDGSARFKLEDHMRRDYSDLSDTVSAEFMDSLENICRKHSVYKWDGYNKYDRRICDGRGFSLYIKYEDGRSVNAHGMNKFPSGYHEFKDDLEALCEPVCEHLFELGRLQKIEQGVKGDMRSLIVSFASHAPGPIYHYKFFFLRDDLRDNNVDIEIKHSDGAIIPEGDHRFYCRASNDKMKWDKFAALVHKYQLIQWCEWDKHDEENKTAEWFQVAFSFDEGIINASGTAHPENYDAFREEFLQLFMDTFSYLFDNKD